MKYLSQADFKSAIKERKAITAPIRKDYTGPVQITGERQAKFVFSTESVDRDWDIIKQSGIDLTSFLANPVAFFGHAHDTLPIGRCVSVGIENGNLTGVIEFVPADNPAVGAKAEGIYQLCRDGYLSTVSIGFIPIEIEYPDDDERAFRDGVNVLSCELMEISIVALPSNRDAMIIDVSAPSEQPPFQPPVAPEPAKQFRAPRLKRILAAMD